MMGVANDVVQPMQPSLPFLLVSSHRIKDVDVFLQCEKGQHTKKGL